MSGVGQESWYISEYIGFYITEKSKNDPDQFLWFKWV